MKNFYVPVEFAAHFLLTNYCNSFCRHCHMASGPHQPKHFISIEDVMFFLNEFDKEPKFRRAVGFNGGEIMTAYKEYSPDYIPTLVQECVNRNYRIDLRTNALWTEDNTINDVIWDSFDKINFSKYKNKISFSLSIDEFHNNESANIKLISRLCNSKLKKYFELSAYLIPDNPDNPGSDNQIYYRVSNLLYKLAQDNIKISEIPLQRVPERYNCGVYLNKIPFFIEAHNFGSWGRAKEFGIGRQDNEEKHIAAQFDVITKEKIKSDTPNSCVKHTHNSMNFIFSFDGTVDFIVPVNKDTPGVAYRDGNGYKNWKQLYPEMVANLTTRFDILKKIYPQITKESVGLCELQKKLLEENVPQL